MTTLESPESLLTKSETKSDSLPLPILEWCEPPHFPAAINMKPGSSPGFCFASDQPMPHAMGAARSKIVWHNSVCFASSCDEVDFLPAIRERSG
jgi:hypothetical protein